jgi:hypothetical protein
MRFSLGAVDISDASVLEPGTHISFTVGRSGGCVVGEDDLRSLLHEWAGSMIEIVTVDSPLIGDMDVTAVLKGKHSAGSIRAQIQKALDWWNDEHAILGSSCLWLKGDQLYVAGGGTSGEPPNPPGEGIPWSTTLVVLSAAAFGAVFLLKR